jgi:hypothetical protein
VLAAQKGRKKTIEKKTNTCSEKKKEASNKI